MIFKKILLFHIISVISVSNGKSKKGLFEYLIEHFYPHQPVKGFFQLIYIILK